MVDHDGGLGQGDADGGTVGGGHVDGHVLDALAPGQRGGGEPDEHVRDGAALDLPEQAARAELVAILCDLYCTRGGDEPKPLPQLTAESLREAVAFRTQSCARGWHEAYYEPDNEDVVTLWAHTQIDKLLPDLGTD